MKFLFAFINVVSLVLSISAYNILAFLPLQYKSHYIIFSSVLTELAYRGHNVTVVNSFPKSTSVHNFTDVNVKSCFAFEEEVMKLDAADTFNNPWTQIPEMMKHIEDFRPYFSCKPLNDFLGNVGETSFDLVITEIFFGDVMLAYAIKFKAPIVSFCAGTMYPWIAYRTGNPFNPSYMSYPHTNVPAFENESFFNRLHSTMVYVYATYLYYYYSYFVGDPMVRDHFGDDYPSLSDIAKNTSLILTFSHFSVNTGVPMVPNIVEIAGVQIKNAKTLPKEIEKFIEESEHGVIYFCLGSLLREETMPPEKLNAFLKAFSKLPQRVLWKWGADVMPGKTDDIFIAKWMPQRDILAHKNIKLFISHGGALGLNEAVFEGIPVLGIPMFADQTLNLKTLKSFGAAEILKYAEIDDNNVLSKLQLVLNNTQYSENMKKISAIFRDRPLSPMDTAVYWLEYVIRHNGAHHLRSAAVDFPFYQYVLLDVIGFILLVLFVIVFLCYRGLKLFCKFFDSSISKCVRSQKITIKKQK